MKTKRHSPLYNRLVAIAKSKRARYTIAIIYLFFAFVTMICIDESNEFRHKFVPILDNTVVVNVFEWFGIQRYNVTASSWVFFMGGLTIATVLIVGNILAPHFVRNKVKKNIDLFSSETKVRVFYTALWYGGLFLISVLIIFALNFLGAFSLFSANRAEKSPFISLAYASLILAILLISVPLALLIVYLVLNLMNNKVAHFSNSNIGEQWYSLFLEEPKVKMQRPRSVYR